MDEGVAKDVVHVRCLEVCLREDHDVNLLLLHGVSNGVHLTCFQQACGVPAAKVEPVFGWDVDVMECSVGGVRVEYVVFEP